jgi:hypothetical protein
MLVQLWTPEMLHFLGYLSYVRIIVVLVKRSLINDEPTDLIEHNEQTLEENLRGDNETLKKSKRQKIVKSFGDDFIVYLMDDTPRTIEETYSSLDADY